MYRVTSNWLRVPGVPQGSVFDPLLFLAYTIDLPNCVSHPTQCDQFADDTALSSVTPSARLCEEQLQHSICATSTQGLVFQLATCCQRTKTLAMVFTRRPCHFDPMCPLTWTKHRESAKNTWAWSCWQTYVRTRRQKLIQSSALSLLYEAPSMHPLTESSPFVLLPIRTTCCGVCVHSLAQPSSSHPWQIGALPEMSFYNNPSILALEPPSLPSEAAFWVLRSLRTASNYWTTITAVTVVMLFQGFQLSKQIVPQHPLNECFSQARPARPLCHHIYFHLPTPHTALYQSSSLFSAARISVLFTPSLGRVRRPCRGLQKYFLLVLQRCYGYYLILMKATTRC